MIKRSGIFLALALLALAGTARAAKVGDAAPEISAPFLQPQQEMVELTGHVVVIDVMASWCGPCREELPLLENLYQKYKARGVVVVGVGIDHREKNLRDFVHSTGVTFPIKHDIDARIASALNPSRMPSTFLVDRAGRIVSSEEGFSVAGLKRLHSQIEQLLTQSAAEQPALAKPSN